MDMATGMDMVTGMIGVTTMGMITDPGGRTILMVAGIRVTESMPPQVMAIMLIPTSASHRDTAGIHALTMSMGTSGFAAEVD